MSSDNEESSDKSTKEEDDNPVRRVQYNPDDMWFDYLLYLIRQKILYCTIT